MRLNIIDLLLPRETKFFSLLEQLTDLLLTQCTVFRDLVVQIESLSEEEIKKRLYTIKDCESKGDKLEVVIINELDRAFITPLDREDIQTLAIQTEKSLDILNGMSRKVEIYRIYKMPTNACKFAEKLAEIATLAAGLVHDLREKRDVRVKVEAMHHIETHCDELFHDCMAELFGGEDRLQTTEMTKLKEFYEHIEAAVDSIDFFGKLVRGIRIKQS
jgi:uncharacterized protein